MTEAWLQLGNENSAARLAFKRLGGSAGVGLAQLQVTVEVASRKAVADNRPLWLGGSAYAQGIGRGSGYVGEMRTQIQPLTLPERGGTRGGIVKTCGLMCQAA
ncbi:hypothetical protein ACF3NS_14825 [Arsenicicoccus cauae]|uniref:hypothetical protein n=1 Tax=Arsenicicoccus cauae TaxID=2663847 RepID=UPI00370D79A8